MVVGSVAADLEVAEVAEAEVGTLIQSALPWQRGSVAAVEAAAHAPIRESEQSQSTLKLCKTQTMR